MCIPALAFNPPKFHLTRNVIRVYHNSMASLFDIISLLFYSVKKKKKEIYFIIYLYIIGQMFSPLYCIALLTRFLSYATIIA